MIHDYEQQRKGKDGKQLENEGQEEIEPFLIGTPFRVVGRNTKGGSGEENRPIEVRKNLQVPSGSCPGDGMIDPDCDLVIYDSRDYQVLMAIHVRMNLREVEKNYHWVDRMRKYTPTSHIGHIILTADVDKQLGLSPLKSNGKIRKQRDTLFLYDATYVMREYNICESPRLLNKETSKFDTLIVRPFSKFNEEIVNRLIHNGKVDFSELRTSLITVCSFHN